MTSNIRSEEGEDDGSGHQETRGLLVKIDTIPAITQGSHTIIIALSEAYDYSV